MKEQSVMILRVGTHDSSPADDVRADKDLKELVEILPSARVAAMPIFLIHPQG